MANDFDDNRMREGFFAEAEELIEALDRLLVQLDAAVRGAGNNANHPGAGGAEAELVNEVFRVVHTLKGLSSLFGAASMSTVSHELEDVLDDLRLGRVPLTQSTLDLLFKSAGLYEGILKHARGKGGDPTPEVQSFLLALKNVAKVPPPPQPVAEKYVIPSHVRRVLTQYEEHRLKANIDAGLSLFWLRVRFLLATVETSLESLKSKTRTVGEIISYLPIDDVAPDPDGLTLQILIATRQPIDAIRSASASMGAVVEEVERGPGATQQQPPAQPEVWSPPPIPPAPIAPVVVAPPPITRESLAVPDAEPTEPNVVGEERERADVRVDLTKLDDLLNGVAELASVRGALAALEARARNDPSMKRLVPELERLRRTLERGLAQVQAQVLDIRMVPLHQMFDRLARTVRQTARERNKEVGLVVTGGDTEIDKLIVEELGDPLMRLLQATIEQSIEARDARASAKKPASATIAINAYKKAQHVVIDIEDDGRGERATTASEVNLDLSKVGGFVEISNQSGIGTKIVLTLPTSLAVMSVLVVEVLGRRYCMPVAGIEEAIAFEESAVQRSGSRELITLRGASLTISRLGELFQLDELHPEKGTRARDDASPSKRLLIGKAGERRMGFVVDRLLGREDVVIKQLGRRLRNVRGVSGAAELADQRLGVVLDIGALIEEVFAKHK